MGKKVNVILDEFRQEKGITTKQIAKYLHVDQSVVETYFQQGQEGLNINLNRLCAYLQISTEIIKGKSFILNINSLSSLCKTDCETEFPYIEVCNQIARFFYEKGQERCDDLTKETAYDLTKNEQILNLVELPENVITEYLLKGYIKKDITFYNFKMVVGMCLRDLYKLAEWKKKKAESK